MRYRYAELPSGAFGGSEGDGRFGLSLARENAIPIIVFSIEEDGGFARVLQQGKFTACELTVSFQTFTNRHDVNMITPAKGGTEWEWQMSELDLDDIRRRMDGSLNSLKTEFMGLRAGRASTGMLEPIMVEAYGSKMPISQVGNISAPESRLLTVTVWDASLTSSVEKAIRESDLGLNPMAEGR